ncbi:SHC SH2 domain-binding protein 1-like B [Exaiptasia diaphana]|nr:SHC SH2 domain-binding protein 1-like B [Exaiptasia diaphana]
MALFGIQFVLSCTMAMFLQKLSPYISPARWILCNGWLIRYLHPSDEQLRALAGKPAHSKGGRKKTTNNEARKSVSGPSKDSNTFTIKCSLDIELEKAQLKECDVVTQFLYSEYKWLIDFAFTALMLNIAIEVFAFFFPAILSQEFNLGLLWNLLVIMFSLEAAPIWVFKFCLAFLSAFIGSFMSFPGMRVANMYLDSLYYCKETRYMIVLLHVNFLMPLVLVLSWITPIVKTPIVSGHWHGSDKLQPLISESSFNFVRICAVLLFCILRLSLTWVHLQSYLNMAQERMQKLKRETGRITNLDLQRKVASVFYYLSSATLQYLAPTVFILFTALIVRMIEFSDWPSLPEAGSTHYSTLISNSTREAALSLRENLSYEDRYWAYQSKILGDCSADQVSVQIKKYVALQIEPGSWKAIWRSKNVKDKLQHFDVVVEVSDINVDKLTADIAVCEPLVIEPQLPAKVIEEILMQNGNAVPLTEIYPVYDASGENDDTALAIEHVRFFYENVWREWDEDDDSGCSYTSLYLEQRLRLFYDIRDGLLPKELIRKYQDNYAEYKNKLLELEKLRDQMATSDSEQELDDLDVLKCALKNEECNTLVHSLQMMENPQMRYLLAAVSPGAKAALTKPRGPRSDAEPCTLIVAKKLMAYMVKNLSDNTTVEHYHDLSTALESYFLGDTIHIYPGTYYLEDAVNLAEPVQILGIGDSNRISVSCQDSEDFSINCQSSGILFKNIMFEQEGEGGPRGMLVVHKGQTTLEDCQLNCGITGVSVMKRGHLVMRKCKLYDAKSTGVTAQPEGKVYIENCDFYNCGDNNDDDAFNSSAAVQLQQDSDTKPDATLIDNSIHNNSGYGVCVVRSVSQADENPECAINLDVTTNRFRGNKFGDVCHIYLDSSNKD